VVKNLGEWVNESAEYFLDLRNFSHMLDLVFSHGDSLSDVDYACLETLISYISQKVGEVFFSYEEICKFSETFENSGLPSLHDITA